MDWWISFLAKLKGLSRWIKVRGKLAINLKFAIEFDPSKNDDDPPHAPDSTGE
jgi:hypothetical protein